MTAESETKPHVVYQFANPKDAMVFGSYAEAHRYWKIAHNWNCPYEIVTLGQRCTPAAEAADVSE
jgi:hypothetical protein